MCLVWTPEACGPGKGAQHGDSAATVSGDSGKSTTTGSFLLDGRRRSSWTSGTTPPSSTLPATDSGDLIGAEVSQGESCTTPPSSTLPATDGNRPKEEKMDKTSSQTSSVHPVTENPVCESEEAPALGKGAAGERHACEPCTRLKQRG